MNPAIKILQKALADGVHMKPGGEIRLSQADCAEMSHDDRELAAYMCRRMMQQTPLHCRIRDCDVARERVISFSEIVLQPNALGRLRAEEPAFAKRKPGDVLSFSGAEVRALPQAQAIEFVTLLEEMTDRCSLIVDVVRDESRCGYVLTFKEPQRLLTAGAEA